MSTKRGRKPSTKTEASDANKTKKLKPSDEGSHSDTQDRMASLPLHGEHIPAKGYPLVPPAAKETRQSLTEVFQSVRNLKKAGEKPSSGGMDECRARGALLFVTLKKLNRLSHLFCKEARDKTQESKQGMDVLHLQLQNLNYEMVHLSKEISNCLQFQSSHDSIQLVSEEEFYAAAPAEISKPEETRSNDHQRMMSRLNWELQQRQELTAQKDKLGGKISLLEADIAKQQAVLGSLRPLLDKLLEASLPIQDYLQMPLDKKRREHSLAQLLPRSLYILYTQSCAYCDAEDDVVVSIHGDEEEAKNFSEKSPDSGHDLERDSDSDEMEVAEKSTRRKSQSRSSVSKVKDAIKPHPLFVQIDMTVSESCSISLAISYIPVVGVACVDITDLTTGCNHDNEGDSILDKDTILHDLLLQPDRGDTMPNTLPHQLVKQLGLQTMLTELHTRGLPYCWVQSLCGLGVLGEYPKDSVGMPQNVDVILVAIKRRILVRLALQLQLNLLMQSSEEGVVLDPGPGENLFPSNFHSKMVRFKRLSREEAVTHSEKFSDSSIFDLTNLANKFYLISFQLLDDHHKPQSQLPCRLHCLACISSMYPRVPPTFTLTLETQGQKQPHSHWIKGIEAEVNVHHGNLMTDGDHQYLLPRQLLKIQTCFDSLESTYPSDPVREAFLPPSMFPQKYQGRDRMPAYRFVPEKGVYSHTQ